MQIRFGECRFDGDARRAYRNGEPLHLTPKAFDLLALLIEASPRAVQKAELRRSLWPDVVVDEANLKNLIAEIRAALGESSSRAIRTVHRYGYAFTAEEMASGETPARLIQGDRIHRLGPGENVIGRERDCSVVIDFTGVSRRHAIIRVSGDSATLEDLGSKNGTWKNNERVRATTGLRDGDHIRLGAALLIFRSNPDVGSTTTFGQC